MVVALRKESVDRNKDQFDVAMSGAVALRKESVDRNICAVVNRDMYKTSLSARRAWIEIRILSRKSVTGSVALRKESVDRNKTVVLILSLISLSLSARRAWIEIRGVRVFRE